MLPWLEATALATWVRESPSLWAYPTVLTLHTTMRFKHKLLTNG